MVRVELIKAEAVKRDMSMAELAREIGIAPATMYKKCKKGVFNSDEIGKIIKVLHIQEPMPIFFPDFVA